MFEPDATLFEAAAIPRHPVTGLPLTKRKGPWDGDAVVSTPQTEVDKIQPVQEPEVCKAKIRAAVFAFTRACLRETIFTHQKRFRYRPSTIWRTSGLLMGAAVLATNWVDSHFGARADWLTEASCQVTLKNEQGRAMRSTYQASWLSSIYGAYNACRDAIEDAPQDRFVSARIRQVTAIPGLEDFLEGEEMADFGGDATITDRADALDALYSMETEGPRAYLKTHGSKLSREWVVLQMNDGIRGTENWMSTQVDSAKAAVSTGWNNALDRLKVGQP